MARFSQLDRLARYRDEELNERTEGVETRENFMARARNKKPKPIDQLPIDEVFRRINAGEYLE